MATNLESTYHLCQLAHPLMKASGAGSIVFISSVAGLVSLGSGTIYAATKGEHYSHIMSKFGQYLSLHSMDGKRQMLQSILFAVSAAINQLTKTLACEWAKDNIRSNAVAPWYTRTSLVEHVMLVLFPFLSSSRCFA